MARYIDADLIPYVQSENGTLDDYAFRYDINEVPAADVVEVVRCKDCVHCEHFFPEKQLGEEAREVYYCGIRKTTVRATDFCSYGVRREG